MYQKLNMGRIKALQMRGATEKKCSLALILFGLMVALQGGFASGRQSGPPPIGTQRVTGGFHTYAEVFAACSPDGRWLAFEYNELNDPDFPRVGMMRLAHGSHAAWHPLLKGKPGRRLYVGDFSWSPDSRWLALITDYPDGAKNVWSEFNAQVVKVNVDTGKVVRLTNFPANTISGPTTAWLRSGSIVFTGDDENIYAVPEKGGNIRKLIDVPKDKCGGVTNTLAVSPDEQRVIFEKDSGDESQTTECNALWISDLNTSGLRRLPTTGLRPLNPFWLDEDTVLFSGIDVEGGKWLPSGIYRISLRTGEVSPVLKGFYDSPFVCDSGKTLYFSWGLSAQTEKSAKDARPTFNGFSGFHIWRIPLRDLLQHTNDVEHPEASKPKQ
jgi:Tol biopolymer transport system component